MSGDPTRVLFIAGSGRSGTTLLGQLLGRVPGFCFIGEAVYGAGSLTTRRCGCGVPLAACDFWAAVRRRAASGRPPMAADFFALGRLTRWRHLPATLLPAFRREIATRYGEHSRGCQRLYDAIREISGAEVIVDSSKAVPYGRVLSFLPGIDLGVVHLVRDARAVGYSWSRWKVAPDRFNSAYMDRRSRLAAAAFWSVSNLGAELFLRHAPGGYLRVRYEDLMDDPREALGRIVRQATRRPVNVPFLGDRTVEMGVTHSVKGNPDRMRAGPVDLTNDDEWKVRMPRADYRVITALTWPLLARYGYVGRMTNPRRGDGLQWEARCRTTSKH